MSLDATNIYYNNACEQAGKHLLGLNLVNPKFLTVFYIISEITLCSDGRLWGIQYTDWSNRGEIAPVLPPAPNMKDHRGKNMVGLRV